VPAGISKERSLVDVGAASGARPIAWPFIVSVSEEASGITETAAV
jgi:hypothetical protein